MIFTIFGIMVTSGRWNGEDIINWGVLNSIFPFFLKLCGKHMGIYLLFFGCIYASCLFFIWMMIFIIEKCSKLENLKCKEGNKIVCIPSQGSSFCFMPPLWSMIFLVISLFAHHFSKKSTPTPSLNCLSISNIFLFVRT